MSILELPPSQRGKAMSQRAMELSQLPSQMVQSPEKVILTILSWLILAFSRPFALLTQGIFRKDIGERYFTGFNAILGLVLLVGLTYGSASMASGMGYYNSPPFVMRMHASTRNTLAWVIGIGWIVCFAACTGLHFWKIRQRYQSSPPALWHSRCLGLPRVPLLYEKVQWVIQIALIVLTGWMGLLLYSIALLFSLLVWSTQDAIAKAMLQWEMLDRIDARIEMEYRDKAIEERLSPQRAAGLNVSLPSYVSDEMRRTIIGK